MTRRSGPTRKNGGCIARLDLEPWTAVTGAETSARLRSRNLWTLGETAMGSDEGVDAEDPGLGRAEGARGGRVVGRRPVRTAAGVDGPGVGGTCYLDLREHRRLVDVGGVGGEVTALEALAASQEAPALEHVLGVRVQSPVVALAWPPGFPRNLHEAVVQRQVVPDGVLPLLGVVPVEGEALRDELVDAAQREAAVRRVGDGHGDEGDVAVGGLAPLQGSLSPAAPGRFCRLGVSRREGRLGVV